MACRILLVCHGEMCNRIVSRVVIFKQKVNSPLSSLSNAPQAAVATPSTGLNFTVTEEQQEFLDLAEQFTKNEIIPVAPHYDRTGEYPWPVLKKAHETGLMNLHIPQVHILVTFVGFVLNFNTYFVL